MYGCICRERCSLNEVLCAIGGDPKIFATECRARDAGSSEHYIKYQSRVGSMKIFFSFSIIDIPGFRAVNTFGDLILVTLSS